jgi:hypothetical protein
MTLPEPDTHCWDDDEQKDVWSYSKELAEQMLAESDAAIQLMQKDAARYHWLRNTDHWPAVFPDYDEPEPLRGAELDAEIDARMGDPK